MHKVNSSVIKKCEEPAVQLGFDVSKSPQWLVNILLSYPRLTSIQTNLFTTLK